MMHFESASSPRETPRADGKVKRKVFVQGYILPISRHGIYYAFPRTVLSGTRVLEELPEN